MLPPFPVHYKNRIAEIESELNSLSGSPAGNIVLFGDSISEMHPATRLRGRPVINMGISGDEAEHPEGGLFRRVNLLTRANPAEIFVLIGINDLNNGKKPDSLAKQVGKVLDAVREIVPAASIYLQTTLPTSGQYLHLLPDVRETNERLSEIAEARRIAFVDVFSAMTNGGGELREELTDDGVHLNDLGYQLWTSVMEAAE
ncbi:MAG: GDSL-type esterase/lipase family protein [Candidatus Sumerlaeaceae bacterium]